MGPSPGIGSAWLYISSNTHLLVSRPVSLDGGQMLNGGTGQYSIVIGKLHTGLGVAVGY